MLASLLLTDF